MKYETRGVLAGRYRGRQMERVAHTHLYNPEDKRATDVEFPALCNKKIGLADFYSSSDEERVACPTCPSCAKRYMKNRSAGRDPGGARMSRKYHIVAINERTRKKYYLTSSPLTHAEAVTMSRKFGPPHKDVRRQLEEVVTTKAKRKPARDHACSCSHPPKRAAKKKATRKKRAAPKRDAQKTCPIGTEIQTLILSQQLFTEKQAAGWARRHGFRVIKVDVTTNNYRFRQHPPSNYRAGSFRTIRIRPGVEAVIGCPV